MNRAKFYNIAETEDGTKEIDVLFNSLSNFKPRYRVSYHRVNGADEQRPDLISYQVYGTVKYWWLILSFNGIQNPFTGFAAGDVIKLPNVLDIYDFYKQYSLR